MSNKEYYVLADKKAIQVLDVGGKIEASAKSLPLSTFFKKLSSISLFDTGIMPLSGSGVLSVRGGLGHTQIATQQAPNIDKVTIGQKEYDPNAKDYLLARPYKVVISDWLDDDFIGARQFYSMKPILSYDDSLYHVNLPNINCLGYHNDVSVGWTCLYHNDDGHQISIQHKINYVTGRMAGGEAYNIGNMSETDGFKLYKKQNKADWTYDAKAWQKISEENDNTDWTLDENLWVPALVESINNQKKHIEGGVHLNFGMALRGNYKPYYNFEFFDNGLETPINASEDVEKFKSYEDRILKYLRSVASKGARKLKKLPDIPKVNEVLNKKDIPAAKPKEDNEGNDLANLALLGEVDIEDDLDDDDLIEEDNFIILEQKMCGGCGDIFEGDQQINENLVQTDMGLLCHGKCLGNNYHVCIKCEKYIHVDSLQDWKNNTKVCNNCDTVVECPNVECKTKYLLSAEDQYPLIEQDGCKKCIITIECDLCRLSKDKDKSHIVAARSSKDSVKNYTLCAECFSRQDICECGFLREMDSLVDVNNIEKSGCMGCIGYRGNGENFYDPDLDDIPKMEINHTVVNLKGLSVEEVKEVKNKGGNQNPKGNQPEVQVKETVQKDDDSLVEILAAVPKIEK